MGKFKKHCCNKKMVLGGNLFKSFKCSWIFTKTFFLLLESVSFHHEMINVTSFKIVLGVYIVHLVIFIKKYSVNL